MMINPYQNTGGWPVGLPGLGWTTPLQDEANEDLVLDAQALKNAKMDLVVIRAFPMGIVPTYLAVI